MKRSLLICFFAAFFASLLVAQPPSQSIFDQIVGEYFKIHDALASDTTTGVDAAAQKIVTLASQAQQKGAEKTVDFATIKGAATSLRGKSLEQAREQFFQLSKPIIAELKRNPSAHKSTFAYKCSMANKTWIQGQKEVRNPYYGKSMQKCGEPL